MQKFDVNNLEFQYIQALLYDTFIPTIPVFSYVPTKEALKEMYKKDSYTSMCIVPSYVISFNKEGAILLPFDAIVVIYCDNCIGV